MRATASIPILGLLALALAAVTGQGRPKRFCGTRASENDIESILSSQKKVFGKVLYELTNTTERERVKGRVRFPKGVKVKLKVANCAGTAFKGFDESVEKLNDGFKSTKIQFRLDKIVRCTSGERKRISEFCTEESASRKACSDELQSISKRIRYTDGILVIVIDAPRYEILGLANVGLISSIPWIMIQVEALPEVSSSSKAWSLENSIPIDNNAYTLVHEIGHALGLFHTFQNGCKFPGDYIPDTPYQSTALSKLPEFFSVLQCCFLYPTSECSSPPTCENESGSNFDNFMDYSPDSCSKRFTSDQIAVMQATLLERKPQWLGLPKKSA